MVFITIRKLKLTCLKCSGVVKKNSANVNSESQKLNVLCHL